MSTWTAEDLDTIGAADELQIAPLRADGSLRRYTTIWVVRVGDDLFVRSVRGRRGGWLRHALERGAGRIRIGGVDRVVTMAEPAEVDHDAIDRAYRSKYGGYPRAYLDPTGRRCEGGDAAVVSWLRTPARAGFAESKVHVFDAGSSAVRSASVPAVRGTVRTSTTF
jgi:hypothetical protein